MAQHFMRGHNAPRYLRRPLGVEPRHNRKCVYSHDVRLLLSFLPRDVLQCVARARVFLLFSLRGVFLVHDGGFHGDRR